jgi:predicted transcriptional regulator
MSPEQKLFKAVLKTSGLTNADFARQAQIGPVDVYRYKDGIVKPPLNKIYAFAEKVGVTITFKIEKKVSETVKI